MVKKEESHATHWDLMMETAKEVAALKDGSHDRLKAEFLEEFGQLPTSEVLDYFDDLLKSDINKIPYDSNKVSKNLSQAEDQDQKLVQGSEEANPNLQVHRLPSEVENNGAVADKEVDPESEFADKIAQQQQATVLGFRQSFERTFNKEPSLEQVAHFLKRLAYNKQNRLTIKPPDIHKPPHNKIKSEQNFIKEFIETGSPTVLTFRRAFENEFGTTPNTATITHFLNELSKKMRAK